MSGNPDFETQEFGSDVFLEELQALSVIDSEHGPIIPGPSPPKVLGLLAVGVEREENVSNLLTNREQCALHKSPRLKRGNLFAVGCDSCRRMKGSWWLSRLGLSLFLLYNTPLWPGFLLDGRLDGPGLVNRLVMPCPRLLLFLCSSSVLLVVLLLLSLNSPL